MESETRELVRFAAETRFESLSAEAVHETKRAILDSVGCALGGATVDKGRISVRVARSLGGPAESTVIGFGDRVSVAAAAFANGELINALDMDCMLAPAHVTPFIVSAPLALGEQRKASGRDLVLAVALGHELSTRIGRALRSPLIEESGTYRPRDVLGFSQATIGGAIGAAKIAGLDQERMLHAAGLAGHMAPVPTLKKWMTTAPSSMDKYLPSGWTSMGEVTAVLLAEAGYAGDTAVLDGEYGFWRFFGAGRWDREALLRGLGKEWQCREISYKPYPCCRMVHGAMDGLLEIMRENGLRAAEIESIRVLARPMINGEVWTNDRLATHIDAQFVIPYIFSVLAHGVPYLDWQQPAAMNSPPVLAFMKKVTFGPHPEFGKAWLKDPRSHLWSVEVSARGRSFKREGLWEKGDYYPEDSRMKDEELEAKFRENASRTLPPERIDAAVRTLFEIEKVRDIGELLRVLCQ
jgi:2-methylcitrate dehydratase PrpD